VKNAISEARNAAMKIGQVMYNQQSGQNSSSEQQEGEQKSENEEKKN
jgi:hypothetical protein